MKQIFLTSIIKSTILTGMLIISLISIAIADSYYIATTGSDGNNGSLSSPWRTVIHSRKNSSGGDTVFVRGGTYSGGEIWLQPGDQGGGNKNNLWTLKNYAGEIPIFENTRFIVDAGYIRIQGIHFTGTSFVQSVSWSGMHEYIEFLDNNISSSPSVCLYFMGNNSLVQGNHIESSSAIHGIYVMHGDSNIVRNNYVSGISKYGIHVYDENKYSHPARITNLLVENNTVIGSQGRSGIIISAGESTSLGIEIDGVVVRNNIVVDNAEDGITIRYYGSVRNVDIFNNVMYNNHAYGLRIIAHDVDNVTIKNNIFSSNTAHIDVSSSLNNLVVSHNLYWQRSSIGTGAADDYAVFQSPLFVNANELDFHLTEDSPAIDAGVDVGLPYYGIAPDIGAFEYNQYPVPVELTSFKASVKDNVVQLNWHTASAINNLGFDVERSTNKKHFQKIGFVRGHGTTNMPKSYHFLDEPVKQGKYYYRIKQLDLNGAYEYSSIVEINVELQGQFNLQQNYPNPFNPSTEICYDLPCDIDVNLSVCDIMGRHIVTLVQEKQTAGQKTVKWNGTDQNNINTASGIYFYNLKAGEFSVTRKMLLAR